MLHARTHHYNMRHSSMCHSRMRHTSMRHTSMRHSSMRLVPDMTLLVPAALVSLSLSMTLWYCRCFWLGLASRHWPRVEGRVIHAYFSEKEYRDEDGDSTLSVTAHLTYEYVVNGMRFRSKHFTYRPTRWLGQREAYMMLQGVRHLQEIEVYYDPRRLERAVVLPGVDNGNRIRLLLCAIGLLLSFVWLLNPL